MKKLYSSFAAKLIAVILLCLLVLSFGAALAGAATVASWNGYTGGYEAMGETVYQNAGQAMLSGIGDCYQSGENPDNILTGPDSFWYEILDNKGNLLESNYEGGPFLWQGQATFEPCYSMEHSTAPDAWNDSEAEDTEESVTTLSPPPAPAETWTVTSYRDHKTRSFSSDEEYSQWVKENTVTVKGYLPDPLRSDYPAYRELSLAKNLYQWRFIFLWVLGLSFLAGVLLFLFLLRAAGHRKGTDEIVPSFVEKIPFDVFTVLTIAAIGICLAPLNFGLDWPQGLVLLIPCTLGVGLLLLLWCMSFAVRVKLGNLWSNCLIVRALRLAWKGMRTLPLLWKWAVGMSILAFVDFLWRVSNVWSENREAFGAIVFWLLAGIATLYVVYSFHKLRQGAKEIANGNLSYIVNDKYLLWDLKDHANDLNHIRDGMNNALEEQLKSERFRTELITNVSHDIKTPLTSIVNYVDLLAKEEPESERQREYLEVLQRQSGKLKKLTEDLIEASKASTGNLPVSLERCDLGILLDQTAGEYAEKLESAGLELVLQKPDQPVTVLADGRHMWRIFDNLMNNIVKYALAGTRVYLTLTAENGKTEVTFRNISREALNLNARDLSERFVRGDSSRNTEGSGLGLSIAMSLTKLQKGTMDLAVDGDLFKVTLTFDTV